MTYAEANETFIIWEAYESTKTKKGKTKYRRIPDMGKIPPDATGRITVVTAAEIMQPRLAFVLDAKEEDE